MNYWIDFDNNKKDLSYNAWIMYHQEEICNYIQSIIDRLDKEKLYDVLNCGSDDELFEGISKIIYRYSHKARPIFISK